MLGKYTMNTAVQKATERLEVGPPDRGNLRRGWGETPPDWRRRRELGTET